MNRPYIDTLIAALRHEVQKDLESDVNTESIIDLLSEIVANAIIVDRGNLEMIYVFMLVLNSFLKDRACEGGGSHETTGL